MNYWFLYNVSDGSIYGAPYLGDATEWTNIPQGCGVIGPFPQETASAEIRDAFMHPNYYTVRNGSLTAVANMADLQLAEAKATKTAQIQQAYQGALTAGFTSSATGSPVQFAYAQKDQDKFLRLSLMVSKGKITFPYSIPNKDGLPIPFTEAQYEQLETDILAFEQGLETRLVELTAPVPIGAIANATSIEAVNAISF